MGNSTFDLVVGELEEYMGDIWSVGIVKKGVKMVGAMTGRKFALGEDVKGKITVVSPPVSRHGISSTNG